MRVAPALVGGWRTETCRSTEHGSATSRPALTRLYGTELILAPNLSTRPFTGMIRFTGALPNATYRIWPN